MYGSAAAPDSPWAEPPHRPGPPPPEGYEDVDIRELGSRHRGRPAPVPDAGVPVTAQRAAYYPTIAPRQSLERAQLAESQAQVRATVFGRRQEVNDAFFDPDKGSVTQIEQDAGVSTAK